MIWSRKRIATQPGSTKEIELVVAEEGDPVEPLDVGGGAGSPDRTRGEAVGREGHAAAARAPDGVFWRPGRGVVGGEVCLEDHLELKERVGGIGGGGVWR